MILKTWLIVILFLTQITFAFVVHPITGWNDLFPLFHWRLFARVYKKRNTPLLLIKEVDGTKYPTPLVFYDFYSSRGKDFIATMYDDLDQIQLAYYREPQRLLQKVRDFEKKYFLNHSNITFQIVDAVVEIKDFYKTKEVIDFKVLYENTLIK